MADNARSSSEGVAFPEGGDGRRSTSATGRAIFADSVRTVDPAIAARIEHTADWRGGYIGPLRDIVTAAARRPDAALTVSRDGLESAHRRFVFARGGEQLPLWEAMRRWDAPGFGSVTVQGVIPPEPELSLPYRGRRLFGDDLRRQIDQWVTDGIAEPGFAEAMTLLLDNPDWMDLRDVDIAVLGAGAELGPTRSLLRWGARVHAVDLPRPDMWQRLIGITRGTAGSLRIPIALDENGQPPFVIGGFVHPEDDATVAGQGGCRPAEAHPGAAHLDRRDRAAVRPRHLRVRGRRPPRPAVDGRRRHRDRAPRPPRRHHPRLPRDAHRRVHGADGRSRGVTSTLGRPRAERSHAEPAAAAEAVRAQLQRDVRRGRRHRVRHQRLPRAAAGPELRAGQATAAVARPGRPR